MHLIAIFIILLIMAGCAHITPPPDNLLANASECSKNVRLFQQAKSAARVQAPMKSEMGQVVMVMAMAMAEQNKPDPFAACNSALIAYMQAEGLSVQSMNAVIGKGLVVGGTVWAVDSIGEALVGLSAGGGDTIYGSRVTKGNVLNGSGSASSSGAGLGTGNVNAGANAGGGLLSRNQVDTIADNDGTNSNSGEADIFVTPVEAEPVE
jgi:hypothetical protein